MYRDNKEIFKNIPSKVKDLVQQIAINEKAQRDDVEMKK